MHKKSSVALAIVGAMAMCQSARAGQTYSLHENLHAGQRVTYVLTQDSNDHSIGTSPDGKPIKTDTHELQSWTVTETVLAVNNGSATQARVDVAPGSFDAVHEAGQDEKRTACRFIGTPVILSQKADGSVADDYPRPPSANDIDEQNGDGLLLDGLLSPDELSYPEKAVAVGDTWDNSAKLAKTMGLGPKDHITASSKLDWVKEIGGRQIAQISASDVVTYHNDAGPDGLAASDNTDTVTEMMLVDIAAGMIVQDDSKDVPKMQSPANSPGKFVDENVAVFHSEVVPEAGAATQP